tara:strand:+ start:564 stop:677 length:114 start_codon:yes stop_codon:yes gene_type:complete
VTSVTDLADFNNETMKTMGGIIQAADTELYKNKGTLP